MYLEGVPDDDSQESGRSKMVSSASVTYQPSVAYQGGEVNTPQQEPRSGQTQPTQAPAADSSRTDRRTHAPEESRAPPEAASSDNRGSSVDVKA